MYEPPRRLTWEPITLHLRNPFRLSYGVTDVRRVFWLRLMSHSDEVSADRRRGPALPPEGWGEAAIPPYYGVSDAAMIAVWEAAARRAGPWPDDPREIEAWIGSDGPAPARCALDLALHDRIARQRGEPLYTLLGLPAPPVLSTSFTIAIADPEEMARQAVAAADYPILKIKLGSEDDEACLAAVRQARPDARLRVDANAGWSREEAVAQVSALARYDLELIEQPVTKDDIAGMGYVQAHTDLPVVADESVRTLADVEALAAAGVRGVNLKLMKVGGLAPGLRMLRRARELGMSVMLGCMIETSLGTTAMAHLAGLADWLDLDAPLLVVDDPFDGLRYDEHAGVHLPQRPGIGVLLRHGDVAINRLAQRTTHDASREDLL